MNESMVHCNECQKRDWCADYQYMKYTLGIENGCCDAGERKHE